MQGIRNVRWLPMLLIALITVAISAGHYLTPPQLMVWHGVFQRLYYLPVVAAAILYGLRGGLTTAVFTAICYVPHILLTWSAMPHYEMDQYAEIGMFLVVGSVTGVLSDRERKRKLQLEKTAKELDRVYRELQQTFEQVKRADRLSAIGQLAAGFAHEIRNPLASIDGAAEVLEPEGASPEIRHETIGIIRKECARLNRLLTNLLDFARPRRPEWREVNLSRVLDNVIELVRHSSRGDIRITCEVPAHLPPLICDQEQLSQVILNLMINAVQAMPDGGEIRLSAREDGGRVLIEVRDQGRGIPEEDLDRIFDPFYTTKANGTGLGLSVVHQIVAQHAGAVSVRRNPDKGMTFALLLPVARERELVS